VISQTIHPIKWIIVNDGSTDRTAQIAEDASRRNAWIQVVHRPDRGYRQAGGGVIDAFYDGYNLLERERWDFLIKLDADLSFERDYFERCFREFDLEPRLGIAGGTICTQVQGVAEEESKSDPLFHVRGATKIYRAECWRAIGGLVHAPGWDTLDEVKANRLGWITRTFRGINVIHHRRTGAAYGQWNDLAKAGLANYITGYHPVFMLLKCLKRMAERPYLVGGSALWFGFLKGYLTGTPRVGDKSLIRYFRQQQMNRLLGRKSLWTEPGLGSLSHAGKPFEGPRRQPVGGTPEFIRDPDRKPSSLTASVGDSSSSTA